MSEQLKNAASEIQRFNALTPERASVILKQMEGAQTATRSCWYCNGAHEHLKNAEYPILCLWGCGMWYLNGFPATIVTLRSKGESITEDHMAKFAKALAKGQDAMDE